MNKLNSVDIDKRYYSAIGNFFTPSVLGVLEEKNYSPYLEEVCINSGLREKVNHTTTVGDFFDFVYKYLFDNYRNEYVYKNLIASRVLAGKHSLSKSHMLSEFRVGENKADIVLLNGTSTVYEIKSEYDTFLRIKKQIKSYLDAFDHINVITSPQQARQISELLPSTTGIIVLNKNNFSTYRESVSNKRNIKQEILFDSLRKEEYSFVVKEYYGYLPNVPNTLYNKECKKLFCKISAIEAHDLSVEILKSRNNSKLLKGYFSKAPHSTLAYALSIGSNEKRLSRLMDIFDDKIDNYFRASIT